MSASQAGHYVASYAGGTYTVTGVDPLCNSGALSYTFLFGLYGGGGTAGMCVEPPPSLPRTGTVTCTGAVTASFHWTADNILDLEPPPPLVIIKETCTAQWSADGGTCSNGLGDPELPTSGYNRSSTGSEWTSKSNPGYDFSIPSRSPSANCTHNDGSASQMLSGTAGVSYFVETYPVRIVFGGTVVPASNHHILIGQQVVASLDKSGLGWADDTYTWTILGGDPFADYQVAPPNGDTAVRTPYAQGTHLWSTTTFFGRPDVNPVFFCQAFIGGPIQQTFFIPRSLRTDKPVSNYYIATGSVKQGTHPGWLTMGLFDAAPIPVPGTNNTASWWGVRYAANPLTPSLYIQGNAIGGWHWVQTIVPSRFRSRYTVYQNLSTNGMLGLDTRYPTFPWPYWGPYPANGELVIDGDAPSVPLEYPPYTYWEVRDERFKTYPMYIPPAKPGFGRQWVALKEMSWNWSGTCQRIDPIWFGPSGATASCSFSADFPRQPQWEHRHLADASWLPPQ